MLRKRNRFTSLRNPVRSFKRKLFSYVVNSFILKFLNFEHDRCKIKAANINYL